MKHRFLFILFLVPLSLNTQTFNFGLKTGLSSSVLHGDGYSFLDEDILLNLDPTIGIRFTGGAIARLNVTPSFSIQTEILYTTKGARFNEEVDIRGHLLNLNGNVTLGYIELPLLLRFTTTLPDRGPLFYPKPGTTFNAYFGAAGAYKTRATFSGDISGEVFGVSYFEEYKNGVWNQFTDIDLGVVVGLGFEYGARDETKYFIDLRFTYGLMDIGDDPETNISLRNSHASISMGILF
jgi:hypothetical protein